MTATIPSSDRFKINGVLAMRRLHDAAVQEWSKQTYRTRNLPSNDAVRVVPANEIHTSTGWLPTALKVPHKIPKSSKLPVKYLVPYYLSSKVGWSLYNRFPVDEATAWQADADYRRELGTNPEGWTQPASDESFAAMRLQGNPFLLRWDDEAQCFIEDWGPIFDGVFPDLRCEFDAVPGGGLAPTGIRLDGRMIAPGDDDWMIAKRAANGLNGRYIAFVQHLLYSHLIVGQAAALGAWQLAPTHRLRSFLDFFSYGTLVVNDFAYKALLAPSSYFLVSGFFSEPDVAGLFRNSIEQFDLDEWMPLQDIERRGLDRIDNHPYVEDATLIWPAIRASVAEHLDRVRIGPDDLRSDPDLRRLIDLWADVLPGSFEVGEPADFDRFIDVLSVFIYNNTVHEVGGDLSPYLDSTDPADEVMVNFDHLRRAVNGEPVPEPRLGDVFLMDQATFASRLHNGGNNLMSLDLDRWVAEPRMRDTVRSLRERLSIVEAELVARNADTARRPTPFLRMQPSSWEASISF